LLSKFLSTLKPLIIKDINIPILYQTLFANLSIVIPAILYKIYKNEKIDFKNIFETKRKIIIGILYAISGILTIIGYKLLPMSISIPLTTTIYYFQVFIEKIFYNKPINYKELFVSFIILVGILFIITSKTKIPIKQKVFGISCMLLMNILAGFSGILVKEEYQNEKVNASNINGEIINNNIIPLIIISILSLIYFSNNTFKRFVNEFMDHDEKKDDYSKTLKIIGAFFITKYIASYIGDISFEELPILLSDILSYSKIIFSMILGYIFFGELIGIRKIIGVAIIIVGIIFEIKLFDSKDKERIKKIYKKINLINTV